MRSSPLSSGHRDDPKLELILAAAELGVWDWDLTTNGMEYSARAKAICGFPPDEPVTFEMVRDVTHPDDYPWTSALARRSLDPDIRERRPYEYRLLRKDGSVRWVLAHGHAVFQTVGGVTRATRYIGTIQDITERKQAEEALRAANSRLRLALDAGRMAVWEYDVATGTPRMSPELKRLLGFDSESNPTQEEVRARYYPGERQRVQDAALAALTRGDPFFEVEFRYCCAARVVRWFLLRAEIVRNAQQVTEAVVGVLLDITERKEHERHLEFLLDELSHRSKNLLSVVQAIVNLSYRNTDGRGDFEKEISGRIQALARTHDVLVQQDWRGADIETIIRTQIEPFAEAAPRIRLRGSPVHLNNRAAHDFSIAIYELMTNAVKYGALSAPLGSVVIDWEVGQHGGEKVLTLTWKEAGGPPVTAPERRGFGSVVLDRVSEGWTSRLEFVPCGVHWNATLKDSQFLGPKVSEGHASS